jgi:hypothetical protein
MLAWRHQGPAIPRELLCGDIDVMALVSGLNLGARTQVYQGLIHQGGGLKSLYRLLAAQQMIGHRRRA